MNDKLHPALAEHAKERENEKLRGLLRTAWRLMPDRDYHDEQMQAEQKAWEIETAEVLNAEAEPCAREVLPSDVMGWRYAVLAEPAPAQDERSGYVYHQCNADTPEPEPYKLYVVCHQCGASTAATAAQALTRPAQTEQQPVGYVNPRMIERMRAGEIGGTSLTPNCEVQERHTMPVYAAPVAQTESLHITHRPLIRNAISLLGLRRPVAPDVQRVIDDLEAMLQGAPTPADPAAAHWLKVAQAAEKSELVEALRTCEKWFAKHSPTAPLIGGLGDAEHPMLTFIRAALAAQGGE